MSNFSVQSPAVLKKSDGATKIGRGASTVDADLTSLEGDLSAAQSDIVALQSGDKIIFVADYTELAALPSADLTEGNVVIVTDQKICGVGVIRRNY